MANTDRLLDKWREFAQENPFDMKNAERLVVLAGVIERAAKEVERLAAEFDLTEDAQRAGAVGELESPRAKQFIEGLYACRVK